MGTKGWVDQWVTEVFVEQPLASPGSAKYTNNSQKIPWKYIALHFLELLPKMNAQLWQPIKFTKKTPYAQLKYLPKPWQFYTNPVCVACDILQVCHFANHRALLPLNSCPLKAGYPSITRWISQTLPNFIRLIDTLPNIY